jgi:3-dehydroquinate dehydratase-2
MRILIINGPNLNMLGIREPSVYGTGTYAELCGKLHGWADMLGAEIEIFQSNHEGVLVDKIQEALGNFDGIVINPAAYTHTSVAILDALKAVALPTVEVHISDVNAREEFRRHSYVSLYALKTVAGLGFDGYRVAMETLLAAK